MLGRNSLSESVSWIGISYSAAPPSADAVTVGDFNGDGVPDIAVACASGASVSVYMGVGTNINGANPSFTTPETMFYGDRISMVKDAFGTTWAISTHVEDVSDEEMKRRMAKGP